MSWNRPSEKKVEVEKKGGRRNVHLKGLVAGVFVVFGAGLAAWLLMRGEADSRPLQKKDRGLIKEAQPAIPKPIVPKPGMVLSTNRFGKVFEHPPTNQWGNPWRWGPKKRMIPDKVITLNRDELPLYLKLFRNSAETEIAGLLTIEPGTPVLVDIPFNDNFKKSFLQSLKRPIEILPTDTDEARELKEAVRVAKNELKKRMDAGEDVVEIMNTTRKEIRELGLYREDLAKQVEKVRQDGRMTAADLKDCVDAANMMLKDRGLPEIVMPEFYYQRMTLRNRKYQEKMKGQNK